MKIKNISKILTLLFIFTLLLSFSAVFAANVGSSCSKGGVHVPDISDTSVTCGENYRCKFCGEILTDAKKEHVSNGNATCTKNATCSLCGKSIPGTMKSHNKNGKAGYNEDGHWNSGWCTVCENGKNLIKHNLDYTLDANDAEKGHLKKCKACGYQTATEPHIYDGQDDTHTCRVAGCNFVSKNHHYFSGATNNDVQSSSASKCKNPNCTAKLTVTVPNTITSLPNIEDYYMVGSGVSWEKELTTATFTTNLIPYNTENGTSVLDFSLKIRTFEHLNYAEHAGNWEESINPDAKDPDKLYIWPKGNITSRYGNWIAGFKAWGNDGPLEAYSFTYSNKSYTRTGFPNGHWMIWSYTMGGVDSNMHLQLFCNGGCGVTPTPIPSKLRIGYRDIDGNKIAGAPADIAQKIVCWENGPTGNNHTFSVNLELLDELGWRYIGYIKGKGGALPTSNSIKGRAPDSKNTSGSFTPALGDQQHYVVFIFEPIKLTVNHINSDRTTIDTNKNCTYELPKLINQAGHGCSSLSCTGNLGEVITHNNTSLNKYLWPGYILTEYSLKANPKDAAAKEIENKKYDLINNEPITNATTRVATPEDTAKYGANIPKELYQKTVSIPTNISTGEKVGYRSDLTLDFIYSNVDVKVNHLDYKTNKLLKGNNNKDLTYTKTLNGHYFIVSSLITQGDNILTELSEPYNITGNIIRKVDITKKGKVIYSKEFELKQNTEASAEAINVTNLLYYIISSTDITDSALMAEINRIGNDIEFNFYYEKVPILTIKHVDELGNKLWPDEFVPLINDPTDANSKDLTQWGYSYKEYKLDGVDENSAKQKDPNPNVVTVEVPVNGTNNREIVFIYKKNIPTLTVKYVDRDGNEISEETKYKIDKDKVTTSAKDLSGFTNSDGNTYEYQEYKLYDGNTVTTPLTQGGTDVTVTVVNNTKDRLLVYIYDAKANAGSINTGDVKAETVILKSNDRDAEEYDVLRAIPTSEDLYANVITDSFLLSNVVRQKDKTSTVHVKLIQPYYTTSDTDSAGMGTSITKDKAYTITSNGYVDLEIPYSYFSASNVQLNIISKAVVKNGSIEVRNTAGNVIERGQVTLTPNYDKEPELSYTAGGDLVFVDLAKNYPSMAGKTVAQYVASLAKGEYNLKTGFYNVTKVADGIYVEYVLPEIQYTEVSSADMAEIVKEYNNNPYLLTKAAEDNDVRVTMDTLKVIRENGSIVTILSGAALPINREYTLIQLENMKDSNNQPILNVNPDAPLIGRDVLYKNNDIYVTTTKENKEYPTTADIYYKPHQRVNPDTLQTEFINTNDTFIAGNGYAAGDYTVYTAADGTPEILIATKKDVPGNSVLVHTPVVNNTKLVVDPNINNTKQWVSQANNRENMDVLVLGKTFELELPHDGKHITATGYGNKAYNYNGINVDSDRQFIGNENARKSFAKGREIRFTFGVIDKNNKYHSVGTDGKTEWIDLNELYSSKETKFTFKIPEWEKELWRKGNYHTIETRVIAENCEGDKINNTQAGANTDRNNYVATKVIKVKVIGKIFDLEIRATDDKGWTQLVSSINSDKFPIGQPGQNKNPAYKYGLKLGTTIYFDIATTGWTGDTTNAINITPTYYFVSKNAGAKPEAVDLFYKYSNTTPYKKITNEPITLTTIMNQDCYKGSGYVSRYAWLVSGNTTGKFIMDAGRELASTYALLTSPSKTNTVLTSDGRKAVNYAQSISVRNPDASENSLIKLPYATRLAYKKAIETLPIKYQMPTLPDVAGTDYCIGHWYGVMRIPSTTVAITPGKNPDKDPGDIKKDGYIIVVIEKLISEDDDGEDYLKYDPKDVDYETELDNIDPNNPNNPNNPKDPNHPKDPNGPDEPDIELPNGGKVDWPELPGDPAIIYELIADKIDYENAITH